MAYEKIAGAIIREVPVTNIAALIKGLQDPITPLANGGGCGQGCGAGCKAPLGLAFDEFGHTGITAMELQSAANDPDGLMAAVRDAIKTSVG